MKHPLLLLHGALATEVQLKPLARELAGAYEVRTLGFGGHGGRPLLVGAFSMRQLAAEVLQLLDEQQVASTHVFGYSMGGYAALAAAVSAPARFRSITTLGTKFDWTPVTAATETRRLDADRMREKVPHFAEQLTRLHAPTPLPELLAATAALMRSLGDAPLLTADNLATLEVPVQVLVGELDQTAGVDASRRFADYMPRAQFEIIMNTPHPLEKVNPDLLPHRVARFIELAEEGMV
ncbi:alpha/beta fold hydrolase [Hymenobacter weizhouensis]|uniref:alpha/beta fold hydrolase n=1 Tax=Hymenobacter sp. YIM 151500-1 TaxID=2987689 RepID=UPI002225C97D|nr:alpha/beta hydrolase [Hymenobacter sp. YIM 151500-1]UYZ63760.1 alpha/beta hydrolase [Hymenobacter sp. YIM 151500-1]